MAQLHLTLTDVSSLLGAPLSLRIPYKLRDRRPHRRCTLECGLFIIIVYLLHELEMYRVVGTYDSVYQ